MAKQTAIEQDGVLLKHCLMQCFELNWKTDMRLLLISPVR
jgi:hypothetical protein